MFQNDPYPEEGGFSPDDDLVRTFGQALGGLAKRSDSPAAPAAVKEPDEALLALVPPQPRVLPDTGLSRAFLTELALKTIHYSGSPPPTTSRSGCVCRQPSFSSS